MRNITFYDTKYVIHGYCRHAHHLWGQFTMAEGGAKHLCGPASLVKWSEYLLQLSFEARARFEAKILSVGLNVDPYHSAIDLEQWSRNPEVLPKVQWSDVLLYMISTPSPYMKESIKVCKLMLSRAT